MADSSQQNEAKSNNYCRDRYFHPSNRPYRGRGRGKSRDYRVDNVERALNELGVRDLREHLDRKHQYVQSRGGPPSDPAYNYLKDPLRENEDNTPKIQAPPLLRSNSYRERGRSKYEDKFIQNPMNIKVELSTSTGQRSYTLNEGSKLADIKHIPDYEQPPRAGFTRGRGSRGRGRGRFYNDQTDEGQKIRSKSTERKRNNEVRSHSRSKSVENKGRSTNNPEYNPKFTSETIDYEGKGNMKNYSEFIPETVDYRGRGRISSNNSEYFLDNQKSRGGSFDGTRGRFRSRGRRWGSRRGRGKQRQTNSDIVHSANTDVATEENWENEEDNLNTDADEPCEKNPEFEDVENNDEETNPPESYSKDISIVVNAVDEGNTKKRTVRFNLNDNEENKNEDSIQDKEKDENH